MKIAIVNIIKPQAGSGDGITECAYRISDMLKKYHTVDLVYALESSKRNDIGGWIYTNSVFKRRIKELAKKDYDIIHITNQELGFAAKILKREGSKAAIVTFLFDLMRIKQGFHKSVMQSAYNYIAANSIKDAVDYSDMLIFSASSVARDTRSVFKLQKKWRVVYIGPPKESFATTPIPEKIKSSRLNVGYVAALAYHKNAIFILKTAERLMNQRDKFRFTIWGSGVQYRNLVNYKKEHQLDNLELRGFAPEDKLLQIYDSFDVFMYPTLEEGTSLPVFNAQARGLPVILYKGNKLADEVTKYCFIAKDEDDAASMLKDLREKGYNQKQRETATKYARGFTWERVVKETMQVYGELITKR